MAHFCKKLQADCRRGWMLALTAMLIVFAPAAFAQSAPTVTGTVTDQSGQPVIGATSSSRELRTALRRAWTALIPSTCEGGGILLT